jgi:hypothetical protein
MVGTEDLIAGLSASLTPVRPLRPPLWRCLLWLAFTAAVVGVLTAMHGLRPDIASQFAQPHVLLQWLAALATGILAAIAAFELALPDRSDRWLLLPLPGLALWASSLGAGCLTDWVERGPQGLIPGTSFGCMGFIAATSIPVCGVLLVMLRHAGPIRPRLTAALGALSAAALASAGLTLFHELDATVMVLIWHAGTVTLLTAAALLSGRRLFALLR